MSDAKIIDAFGGPSKLGVILDLDRRVVANWKLRGIPKPWRILVAQYAASNKVTLPRNFITRRVNA